MKRLIFVFALLGLYVASFAQGSTYRLQPEDVIRVQVFNQAQISGDFQVGRDGYVTAPFTGSVKAQGKTVDELIVEFTRIYKERLFLKEPIVSVTIVSVRRIRATVGGGGIQAPKTVDVRPGDTVLTLFTQGGGAIRDQADLRRSYLRRAGSTEAIPVDLYALTVFADTSQNYEIRDGDELIVPEVRGNLIVVMGAVQRPGTFPYREPMTAMDAIGLAGGEIRLRTRFSRTVVLRQKTGLPGEYYKIPIDLVKFVRKQESSQNVLLQPGDFIFVPETNTPDFAYISQLAQVGFLLDRAGRFFGFGGFLNN